MIFVNCINDGSFCAKTAIHCCYIYFICIFLAFIQ